MDKTRLLFITLSDEQIQKVKSENGLTNKSKPTHAIVWEGHGQIFGTEKQMNTRWYSLSQVSKEDEKPNYGDIFSECAKIEKYDFINYIEKSFKDDQFKYFDELDERYNAKRLNMSLEEYKKTMEEMSEPKKKSGFKGFMKKLFYGFIAFIVLIVVVVATIDPDEKINEIKELEKKALAIPGEDIEANYFAYKQLVEKNEFFRDDAKYDKTGKFQKKFDYYKKYYDMSQTCRISVKEDTKKLLQNPTTYDFNRYDEKWDGKIYYYQPRFSGKSLIGVETQFIAKYKCELKGDEVDITRIFFRKDN